MRTIYITLILFALSLGGAQSADLQQESCTSCTAPPFTTSLDDLEKELIEGDKLIEQSRQDLKEHEKALQFHKKKLEQYQNILPRSSLDPFETISKPQRLNDQVSR